MRGSSCCAKHPQDAKGVCKLAHGEAEHHEGDDHGNDGEGKARGILVLLITLAQDEQPDGTEDKRDENRNGSSGEARPQLAGEVRRGVDGGDEHAVQRHLDQDNQRGKSNAQDHALDGEAQHGGGVLIVGVVL